MAGSWLAGILVGAQWEPTAGPLLVAVAIIVAVALALHGRELRARLWAAPFSLLALLCGLGVTHPTPIACDMEGHVTGTARVESVRYGEADARLRLELLDGRLTGSNLRFAPGAPIETRIEMDHAPPVGSMVALRAELRPRTTLRNPSPHPALSPRRAAACWARREQRPFEVVAVHPARGRVERARARLRRHLRRALPADSAAVARALVLGDGAALGYERRRTIAAVGLAHLFAVSGLHVALVSGTLVALLRWLVRGWTVGFDPRRLAAACGAPLAIMHALFAGGSPSAWRAAITAAITWTLVAAGRRPSPSAVTAVAALLLSAPNPAMALRPAFLLSIIATSAILSAPQLGRAARGRWLRASAVISARTLVATTPLVWWWFGGVPLIGWLTNIVVLPLGSWVVIPLAHLFALTAWMPSLEAPLASALTAAVDVLLSLCNAFAPLALTQRLPPLDPAQGLIVAVACVLLLLARRWRERLAIVAAAALLWLSAERALVAREQPRGLLRVTFLDVGQGDATLIDFPDGRLALVDTGRGGRHPAVRELRSILASRRRTRIDLLIVTHGHPDHYGGLTALLGEVQIGEIWLNGQLLVEERDGTMERLLNEALSLGTELRFAPELCETTRDFGGAQLEVLWPCPRYDPTLDLNDNSLTVRVTYGRRAFLLTGDLESEAERRLVQSGRTERADVLKVAHHGSRTSTTAEFLTAVQPSVAVVSCGAGNRYGHPAPRVLDRLRDARVQLFRTDLRGGVIATTDGESLDLRR